MQAATTAQSTMEQSELMLLMKIAILLEVLDLAVELMSRMSE